MSENHVRNIPSSGVLKTHLRTLYRILVRMPIVTSVLSPENIWNAALSDDFISKNYGEEYGLTRNDRAALLKQFQRNVESIESGTTAMVHTLLAKEILSIPSSIQGTVVECGCWKGASTASLSLVCNIVGRRLLVCDSFEGLPDDSMQVHTAPHAGIYGYYQKGMYTGRIDEVQGNIRKYGVFEVCDFVQGFYSDSLKKLTQPIAFAFIDVDLVSSIQDCLRYLWPLLVEGGAFYTDDAGDLACVNVFFDERWWQENLQTRAPGYIGSGCGLPFNPRFSSLGYIRKLSQFDPKLYQKAKHLHYPT